tara:strand:- start:3774 stop:3905 length:132 start_codon:yes stop_codon:yes gene_type:complete
LIPSLEHVFFIPAVLLVGLAIGFRLGAKAARDELEKERRRRLE